MLSGDLCVNVQLTFLCLQHRIIMFSCLSIFFYFAVVFMSIHLEYVSRRGRAGGSACGVGRAGGGTCGVGCALCNPVLTC